MSASSPGTYVRLMTVSKVDCIHKGKARQPYDFGLKLGIASTPQGNLIDRMRPGLALQPASLTKQPQRASILKRASAA